MPPRGVTEIECRRAVVAMLTQSLQVLGENVSSASRGGSTGNRTCAVHVAHLQANAHLMQIEVNSDGGNGIERNQQRHQRTTAWHLERAGSALHAATNLGTATRVLLAHLHLAHADTYVQLSGTCNSNFGGPSCGSKRG